MRLIHIRTLSFLLGCCYILGSECVPEAHVLKSCSHRCYWEVVGSLRCRTYWEVFWSLGVCPWREKEDSSPFSFLSLNLFSWDEHFCSVKSFSHGMLPLYKPKTMAPTSLGMKKQIRTRTANPTTLWNLGPQWLFLLQIDSPQVVVQWCRPKQLLHTGSCFSLGTSGVEWTRQKGWTLSFLRDLRGVLDSWVVLIFYRGLELVSWRA